MLNPFTQVFDSEFIPAHDRWQFCREEFGRNLLRLELEPFGDAPFRLRIGADAFGAVQASWVATSPMRQLRDVRTAGDGDDRFGIFIPLSQPYHAGHGTSLLVVRPGEFMAFDSSRSGSTANKTGAAFLSLFATREAMQPLFGKTMPEFGRPYRDRSGGLKLIKSYLRFVNANGEGASAATRELMGRHLAELTALLFAGGDSTVSVDETEGVRVARLAAAHADLDAHFAEPGISASASAARLGISLRYLQSLFEGAGSSFGAELKRRRLNRALALLRDPAKRHLRIIDIALDSGFVDVSNFNRVFRAQFGDTPSGMRAAAEV